MDGRVGMQNGLSNNGDVLLRTFLHQGGRIVLNIAKHFLHRIDCHCPDGSRL